MSVLQIHFRINGIWRVQRNAYEVFLTEHFVDIKYRPAGRKTANINVKNCYGLERGFYMPDGIYKTAKMIYQSIHTKLTLSSQESYSVEGEENSQTYLPAFDWRLHSNL